MGQGSHSQTRCPWQGYFEDRPNSRLERALGKGEPDLISEATKRSWPTCVIAAPAGRAPAMEPGCSATGGEEGGLGRGDLSSRSPTSTYQQAFDGELLQAPVPRRVKDHRQGLVWGLDVADFYLVLCRGRGRSADGHGRDTQCKEGAWTHPLSLCGQGQIPMQCSRREQSLSSRVCTRGLTPTAGECRG